MRIGSKRITKFLFKCFTDCWCCAHVDEFGLYINSEDVEAIHFNPWAGHKRKCFTLMGEVLLVQITGRPVGGDLLEWTHVHSQVVNRRHVSHDWWSWNDDKN